MLNNCMKLIGLLVTIALTVIKIESQCCLELQDGKCSKCPKDMHLYLNNCIFDLPYCESYIDGFDCSVCQAGFDLNISTSECEEIVPPVIVTYEDIKIDLLSPQEEYKSSYDMIINFLQLTRHRLRDAVITGAVFRVYSNETTIVTMQFRTPSGVLYQIITNAGNSYFQILQMKRIEKLTIPQQVTAVKQTIDMASEMPTKLLMVDNFVKKQISNLSALLSGNVTIFSNQTQMYQLVYSGILLGAEYQVKAQINDKMVVTIIAVNQTKFGKKPPALSVPLTLSQLAPNGMPYSLFEPTPQDYGYQIVLDFLSTQNQRYKSLTPTSIERVVGSPKQYYRLRYINTDSNQWEVRANFNTNTYVVVIEHEKKLLSGSDPIPAEPEYLSADPETYSSEDYRFILVLDSIITTSKSKYQVEEIESIEYLEAADRVKYRVVFREGGYMWKVLAEIDEQTMEVSGFSEERGETVEDEENKKGDEEDKDEENNDEEDNDENGQSDRKKITISTNNVNLTTVNGSGLSNHNDHTDQIPTGNHGNEINSNEINSTEINSTKTNSTDTGPGEATDKDIDQSTDQKTDQSTDKENDQGTGETTDKDTDEGTGGQTTDNSTTIDKTASNNRTDAAKDKQKQTEIAVNLLNLIPAHILSRTAGYYQTTDTQMQLNSFKRIDTKVRSIRPDVLNDATLVAAFYHGSIFLKKYTIYYRSTQKMIYEAEISTNFFRKTIHVLGLGRVV